MGAEDLNQRSTIQHAGILHLEGEGEPVEIGTLKRDIGPLADDMQETGDWLNAATDTSWEMVRQAACCYILGRRSRGQDHRQAIALVGQVEPRGGDAAKALGRLQSLSNRARPLHPADVRYDPVDTVVRRPAVDVTLVVRDLDTPLAVIHGGDLCVYKEPPTFARTISPFSSLLGSTGARVTGSRCRMMGTMELPDSRWFSTVSPASSR